MKKKIIISLVAIASVLLCYWIKIQLEFNFFSSFSLGDYLPVNRLYDYNSSQIVRAGEGEYLLNDSFESLHERDNWLKLWMREKGKITRNYKSDGVGKSRCLMIESNSDKDWSYEHNKLVQVKPGDVFFFEGFAKTKGEGIKTSLGVVLKDERKEVVQWNYAGEILEEADRWTKITRRFTVPEGISYINFRLTGSGKGQFWFDEIKFQKQKIDTLERE